MSPIPDQPHKWEMPWGLRWAQMELEWQMLVWPVQLSLGADGES